MITDIISENYGKKYAGYAVFFGFVCQIVSTILVIIAFYLPASDPATQEHYAAVLGQNWVFVLASLVAYLCSQKWDVFIFHKIRDKYIQKHGDESLYKGKWIWNNVGTISSQLLDTVIYATIAFGFGQHWIKDGMIIPLLNMMLAQWIIKSIIALIDTPIFYLFTSKIFNKNK